MIRTNLWKQQLLEKLGKVEVTGDSPQIANQAKVRAVVAMPNDLSLLPVAIDGYEGRCEGFDRQTEGLCASSRRYRALHISLLCAPRTLLRVGPLVATAKEGKTLADSFASFENRTKEHTELSVLGGVLKTCHEFQTTIQDMENRLNGQLTKDVAEPLNAGA